MELVRVHDQALRHGIGEVVVRRERQFLPNHVVPAQPDPGVVRGEPADRLGQPFLPQQLVPEHPAIKLHPRIEAGHGDGHGCISIGRFNRVDVEFLTLSGGRVQQCDRQLLRQSPVHRLTGRNR